MADINTSIKIGADASQAITEMQRLQSVTQQVKTTGENINIAPKVDATAVDALKTKIASTAVEVPVTVKPSLEGAAAVSAAASGAAAAPSAIATPLAASLANEQAAASALQQLNNQVAENSISNDKNVIAAKNAVIGAYNETARSLYRLVKAQKELDELEAGLGPHFEGAGSAIAAQRKKVEELTKAHADGNKALVAARENLKRVSEAAKEAAGSINTATTATTGFRGALNSALEGYKNFSTGASGGVEKLKSMSLNILADIELIKRTAVTFYEVGNSIYNWYEAGVAFNKEIALINTRSVSVQAQFENLALQGKKGKEAVEALNTEITKTTKELAEAQEAYEKLIHGDPEQMAVINTERLKLEAEAHKKRLAALNVERDNQIKTIEELAKRKAELTGLPLLDEETRIRKKAELDIADLQDQLNASKIAGERAAINTMISNRKQIMDKELKDFRDNEQKKKDEEAKRVAEEAKRKADETQRIQDEARAAEIANLDDYRKIEQSYLFDLDKINRRLAAAQTYEEKKALEALGRARKGQRDREFKEYHEAQRKGHDENAAQMKEAARENAEYQKSLMEELIGYQKQLVASFSGLQGSMFPKEAMTYLRQIAGGTNRLPP